MDHQQKDASCSSQQFPLSETECATKLQALVRGYLLRKDYFIKYNFKSASSKEFPLRVYVNVNDLRRFSAISAITMNNSSEFSLCTYNEEEEEEEIHPGFAGNEQGEPIKCPRRVSSMHSNSSFLVSSARMLTLDEDEEHPRFENTVPEKTRIPLKQPTRMLSRELMESEKISDESSLFFSPTAVNALFSAPKGKKMSMLSFSPLPFARGQKVLARRQAARKSAPAKLMQDLPVCIPQRQRSTDAGSESMVSSASRRERGLCSIR
jgi:hypothetical protein